MTGAGFTHPKSGADGFILVAVLWMMAALATLASAYALYVANTATALAVNDDRIQAEALISAGVELAAYRVGLPPIDNEQPQSAFNFRMGRAVVTVAYSPENGRIDLNAAPKNSLAGLVQSLGARAEDADYYADRVIGWRTSPSANNPDAETAIYKAAGLNYGPREAPFAHVREFWLVANVPPQIIERALPLVTIYSGQPIVNVFEAAPQVIAALPGMTPDRLYTFLNQRAARAQDASQARGSALPAPQARPPELSQTIRVTVRIRFDNGRRTGAEAVILMIENGTEPYRVLSWQDDFDQPSS
jgi:general secretion pathway protein K